ncbi:cytochrome c oxidase assembly protein [Gordonia neofelifaecis]|uniref:Cytochrome c oxidase caa3-type, assembly factor CtaG-like protein n=1 Tax=Gordonia neofelifaecis NRRL B-59395 TaxID=644548 RepID=F1YI23_9ACTN|nr:cytochrome c oxidase assembly protein [Gordonia neofelifaecis]EGD55577.1 cytochrome c oxidase caa3-type, assembly factor CtaG-like protein [Gordonia neofelifaecis NRRL B-59395]
MTATSTTTVEQPARDRLNDPSGVRSVLIALLVVVGSIAAVVVTAASAATALRLTGVPDPGWLTTYGLPVMTVIGQISAAIGFGCVVLAAFFVPAQEDGTLDAGGFRAMRWAATSMIIWVICALAMIPLSISNVSGAPLSETLVPKNLITAYGVVADGRYWLWTAIFAALAAVVARVTMRWGWTFLAMALVFLSLMPSALLGHSSSGGAHDLATNSLILHIVTAALWMGGLLAVLAYAFGDGRWRTLAVSRYSRVAFWCLFIVGISGVINALVRMSLGDLFTTTYGLVAVAKFVAVVIAGLIGGLHRKYTIRELEETDDPRRSLFVRFAAVELVVFAVAFGFGAGLSRTPPPVLGTANVSPMELKIGYNLDGPPTLSKLLFDWRFDLIFGTFAIVAAIVYLRGVYRLHKRGDRWPVGRTVSWLLGCAALLIATSSGFGRYAPAMFSIHMMSHMMLSMLIPVLLVLGGPVTLALRAIPPAGRGNPPGPREWILTAIHSPYSRFITNPFIVVTLFVGSFYVLYLGGLFDAVVENHSAHLLMNLHFLVSGYLFYWLVIGIDPAPRQISPMAKLGVVWGSLPFHAFFGVALMMTGTVIAEAYYRSLQHPWSFDMAADQRMGGGIAWATGEFPLVLVMLALLVQWRRQDDRAARRFDRKEERDDDAELESYNQMLREMNSPVPAAHGDDAVEPKG